MIAVFLIKAQNRKLDSLNNIFKTATDTSKVKILCSISRLFEGNDPTKSLAIADSALIIAKRINYKIGIGSKLADIVASVGP